MSKNISLAAVNINADVWRNVNLAVAEGRIGQGRFIPAFEEAFAKQVGAKYAVFVGNGTVGDHIALAAVADKGEVIMPALTFVAQPQAALAAGFTPVFVDVNQYGLIDPERVEAAITGNTAAIMPTHLMGRAVDMDAIMAIAKKHNLPVVEDACEALGTLWDKKVVGTIGDAGVYSFYASHHITTGEGGMVVTSSKQVYEKLMNLRQFGRKSAEYRDTFVFDDMNGTNAKGSNIEAGIGLAVVNTISTVRTVRRKNAQKLNELLDGQWFVDSEKEHISPHGYPIRCEDEKTRNRALNSLKKAGIEARRYMGCFNPESTNAKFFADNWLFVPCHEYLTDEDINYLAKHLKKYAA